jgi:hypothetical protein
MAKLNLKNIEKQRLQIQINLFKNRKFEFLHPDIKFPKKDLILKYLTDLKTKIIAYGGAKGGGKSRAGTDLFVLSCLAYPGIKCFIARNELKRLRASTYRTLLNTLSDLHIPDWAWSFNGQDNVIKFYNGSSIDLLDFKLTPSDPMFERFGSQEYTLGWLEEGGEIDSGAYEMAKLIVGRQPDLEKKYGIKAKLYVSLNPKKNWAYHTFYLPEKENTLPKNIVYIPVLAHENPYNSEDYLRGLDEIEDPIQKARLRDGVWEYEDDERALFSYTDLMKMLDGTNEVAETGEIYLTCDPSREGKDMCVIKKWTNYTINRVYIAQKIKINEIVMKLKELEVEFQCKRKNIIIEDDGLGGGVVDYMPNCTRFVSGSKALDDGEEILRFRRLKTQTYHKLSKLVKAGKIAFDPNFKVIKFGTPFKTLYSPQFYQKMLTQELESIHRESDEEDEYYKITKKEAIKKTIKRSPDHSDCIMFRALLNIKGGQNVVKQYHSAPVKSIMDAEDREYERLMKNLEGF